MADTRSSYSSAGYPEHVRLGVQARCFGGREHAVVAELADLQLAHTLGSVGCGTGVFERGLKARYAPLEVDGLDLEPKAVDVARSNLDSATVGDPLMGAALPRHGDYDAMLSRLVLQHIPVAERQRFVDHVVSAARPGGRVVLVDTDHTMLRLLTGDVALDTALAGLPVPPRVFAAGPALERHLAQAGCTDIRSVALTLTTQDVEQATWRVILDAMVVMLDRRGKREQAAEVATLLNRWAASPTAFGVWVLFAAAGTRVRST